MKHRLHDRAENPEMWASKINEPGLFKKKKKQSIVAIGITRRTQNGRS